MEARLFHDVSQVETRLREDMERSDRRVARLEHGQAKTRMASGGLARIHNPLPRRLTDAQLARRRESRQMSPSKVKRQRKKGLSQSLDAPGRRPWNFRRVPITGCLRVSVALTRGLGRRIRGSPWRVRCGVACSRCCAETASYRTPQGSPSVVLGHTSQSLDDRIGIAYVYRRDIQGTGVSCHPPTVEDPFLPDFSMPRIKEN